MLVRWREVVGLPRPSSLKPYLLKVSCVVPFWFYDYVVGKEYKVVICI